MVATRTRVLGTTRILEPVGKGGMAQVYRGVQQTLGRTVAVKVMLPEIARQKDMAKRFRREARVLSTLQHENIVGVYDFIEKNEQLFMVMEFVDGVDVGDVLQKVGKLPLDVALIVALGVARALEHAHFRRLIHRDIKPANVLLSRDGEVKLADFGIAREVHAADLTHTGEVLGTPSYIAPELIAGKPPDQRSDLYAVGVLLFQCVTGAKPFKGTGHAELFKAISSGTREKVRELAPECPRPVEKIIDRCLETDPAKRWPRAADVRKAIEEELNRELDGVPSARMVSFLYERGYLQPEQLVTLDIHELEAFSPSISLELSELNLSATGDVESLDIDFEPAAPSRRWPLRLGLLALLVLGGVTVAEFVAPASTRAWLTAAVAWVRAQLGS